MKKYIKSELGYIRAICPHCGERNRVEVVFPRYNKPFTSRDDVICPDCGYAYIVSDPHSYNKDGTIREESSR